MAAFEIRQHYEVVSPGKCIPTWAGVPIVISFLHAAGFRNVLEQEYCYWKLIYYATSRFRGKIRAWDGKSRVQLDRRTLQLCNMRLPEELRISIN